MTSLKSNTKEKNPCAIRSNVMVTGIKFPDIPNATFRLFGCYESNDSMTLRLELENGPHMWLLNVRNVKDHGSGDFPMHVILDAIEIAATALTNCKSTATTLHLNPTLCAEESDGNVVTLVLRIPVLNGFAVVFTFRLATFRLHMNMLQASLRDAKEDIAQLRSKVSELSKKMESTTTVIGACKTPMMTVLSSNSTENVGDFVQWTVIEANTLNSILNGCMYLQITRGGVYQVHARLFAHAFGVTPVPNFELILNGSVVACADVCVIPNQDAPSHIFSINEMMSLAPGSSLALRAIGCSDQMERKAQLSVVLLG